MRIENYVSKWSKIWCFREYRKKVEMNEGQKQKKNGKEKRREKKIGEKV